MLVTLLNGCSGQHYPPNTNTQYASHSIDDKDNPPALVASAIKSLAPTPSSGADNAPSELSSPQTKKESALPVSNRYYPQKVDTDLRALFIVNTFMLDRTLVTICGMPPDVVVEQLYVFKHARISIIKASEVLCIQ